MPDSSYITAASLITLLFLLSILIAEPRKPGGHAYVIAVLGILALLNTLRLAVQMQNSWVAIYLPFVTFPSVFLIGPFIYLYAQRALFEQNASRAIQALLISIFFLVMIAHGFVHIHFHEARMLESIIALSGFMGLYTSALATAGVLFNLVFLLMTWKNIQKYEISFEENFATQDIDQILWLKSLVAFTTATAISILIVLLLIVSLHLAAPPVTPIEGGLMLVHVYFVLYYVIKKPRVFSIPQDLIGLPEQQLRPKYQKQKLPEVDRKRYLQEIMAYMNQHKPYLDDKMTLNDLARELNIPSHHVSMVINIERNENFYKFINHFRAEEAKVLLKSDAYRDENILQIGLMAGFQSKASFNKIFKQFTGMTPSEFRAV